MRTMRDERAAMALRDGQETLDWIGDIIKVVLVVIVIMFCVASSGRAYRIGYSIFYEKALAEEGYGESVEVTVTADMSVAQIGNMLKSYGLIEDAAVFPYQERFSSYHGEIQPGTYTLSTEMTPSDMIKVMAEGNTTDATD